MARPLRIAFMGTPALARVILARLASGSGDAWQVVGVVAQPDKPSGRNLHLQPPPVKEEAIARGLPVLQPEKARDPAFIEAFRAWSPDVAVVAAYGQILPQALLDVPPMGCLNVHTSLLPRWRGAAPIQWAIAEGDAETGVSLMRMEAGLDTGPVLATTRTPIGPNDTGGGLHDRLAELGAALVTESLPHLAWGHLPAVPQSTEGITYARKITKDDGRIDWTLPAVVIERRARAFAPWPGTFCSVKEAPEGPARLLKVHAMELMPAASGPPGRVLRNDRDGIVVACGHGALRLLEVQPEGGRRMTAMAYAAGHPQVHMG